MSEIGAKIRYLREQNYLTREELAENLLVNRSTIRRWETHKMTPSESNLIKICRYFKIDKNFFNE